MNSILDEMSRTMKKIFVICATYPFENDYGGVFIRDQCLMLKEAGYDICVLYCAGSSRLNTLYPEESKKIELFEDQGIKVFRHCSFRFAATYTVPLLVYTIQKSADYIYKYSINQVGVPDVLIAHFSYPAGIGAAFLSKKYHIPLITVEHLSLLLKPNARPWINNEIKKVISQSSEFVCVSTGLANGLNKRLHIDRHFRIIPNMIDPKFSYFEKSNHDKYVFLSVGSLIPRKNHELLIRAFARAFSKNEGIELRIVGDGVLRSKLENLCLKLGIHKQVVFTGGLSRENVKREYENSDCFVLLSISESFGIVYREAMAIGRPVISTDHIGIREDWDDRFGVILEDNTIECASDALVKTYNTVFDKQYIAKRMQELYSIDVIQNKYIRVIESTV